MELLQLSGFNAVPVYDGAAAIVLAETFKPDVVFCDIGMSGMDGYDVVHVMRSSCVLKDTKVIALTAWGDDESRAKVIAAGFHAHLVKPANFSDILSHSA